VRIELTPSAERHMKVIDTWWQENRASAPRLFLEELSAAFEALRSVPLTGKLIRMPRVRDVRRVLLRTTRYHIYYRVQRDKVTVLAIWSSVRGRGPSSNDLRGKRSNNRRRR
jgi:plasmid stabilization system protein ParE